MSWVCRNIELAGVALVAVWSLVLLAPSARAQTFKTPPTAYECRPAKGEIVIDGVANDVSWSAAQSLDRFHLPWLGEQARDAATKTKARLLWDRDYLYFTADLEDHDLFASVAEQDGVLWDNDVFELFFKPSPQSPAYYEFQVNALGTKLDMFIPERQKDLYEKFKSADQFAWKTAVRRRGTLDKRDDKDLGWTVEGRLPWSDFARAGGIPKEGDRWKFALCRYDYTGGAEPELSTIAPLKNTKPNYHQHEDYADLTFVGPLPVPPHPQSRLAIRKARAEAPKLTTSKVVGSPDPPLPYRPVRAYPNLKLTLPITLMRQPGSDWMWVIAQGKTASEAVIYRFRDDPAVSELEEVLALPKGGIAYGIAFHPQFAKNGQVFIGWNGKYNDDVKKCRVTRYTLLRKPVEKLDLTSEQEIISWESDGHNGTDLAFGLDGMLLVTSGDGTSDSDTNVTGQAVHTLLAKLLRLDVDHPAPGKQYSVPKDNPFVGQAGVAPEAYAYGFRNPWKLTVDPQTGHIWVGNNGQDLWEQVFFVRPGDNYGWSVYEGGHPFYPERKLGPHPHVKPAADHSHSEARSLTGGVVYHGKKLPELRGAYIYGDHSTGNIWAIKHDGKQVVWQRHLADTSFHISGFAIDTHGELLVADHKGAGEGGYYYLEPTPPSINPPKFPRKLSESGLFTNVAQHAMAPGVIPYSVNSPLWSDGSHKERFIAIPDKADTDMRMTLAGPRGWNFADDSVLIKSFALEDKPGDASTRKWIETRFMVKQQGEWIGYSYQWNDAQTDAELVPAAGLDREIALATRKQQWRFPSRVECMVCHSRAANFVLGICDGQMNREHDYGGGVVEHQYRMLDDLGLLKPTWKKETAAKVADELKASDQPSPANRSAAFADYPKLADPYDKTAPLEARARAYLHANCAHCHVEAGGGNAQVVLDYQTDLAKMKLINQPPVHHKFGMVDPRLIAPAAPERSVLLHRVSQRGEKTGQMPQLATYHRDEAAVQLFRDWIQSLPIRPEPPRPPEE